MVTSVHSSAVVASEKVFDTGENSVRMTSEASTMSN